MSEDNHFEWNPIIHYSDDMSKTSLNYHNKNFKNDKPLASVPSKEDLTNMPFLDIDICNEFLNNSSENNLLTERFALHTPERSNLPNIISPQ